MDDEKYMRRALELARKAASEDETPIGAVIVYRDQIIGEGYKPNLFYPHDRLNNMSIFWLKIVAEANL